MTGRFVAVVLAGSLLILGLLPLATDIPVPSMLGFAAFVLGIVALPIAAATERLARRLGPRGVLTADG
jgi:hypothetical protein